MAWTRMRSPFHAFAPGRVVTIHHSCVCVCARARALSQEELYNAVSNAGDLWGKKKYNGHVRTLCISVFNAIAQTHCDL